MELNEAAHWGNLGDWGQSASYLNAARKLATRLGHTAALKPSECILDLGSGYGSQLRFWHDTFEVGAIDTVEPNDTAREHAQKFNRKSPIPIQWLPSINEAKNTYDAVLSLDAAYHFPDRRALFARCFDLLKPKGRLVLNDLLLAAPSTPGARLLKRISGIFGIPSTNLKSREVYQQELEEIGFEEVSFQDLSSEVLVGFSENWRAALEAHRERPDASLLKYRLTASAASQGFRKNLIHYAVIQGTKP